ncbi:MAG: phosphatidylinositol-specific phospholipase C/glycerophosphodiester phosphodiesterase family protein [Planctomycetales bacterium]|nr:phosphatidylinositol-specific phospholipase C/glycerophosphodiester phosphodiesterase family protein [Planctomycetales bacterium]
MPLRRIVLACLFAAGIPCPAYAEQGAVAPVGHAHNDYRHERPLLDALDNGFGSVEADVYLRDGELLVGHDPWELKPDRTLERLYLAPLAARVKANDGRVHRGVDRFWLFIDIKTDGKNCYAALQKQLAAYDDMLTKIVDGKVRPGAVTVVVSGDRPVEAITADATRYAGIDGRLTDLASEAPPHLIPVISDNWSSCFRWNGVGEMPAAERRKLADVVAQAHAAGRVVRFWATPENEAVWTELVDADVDLINTDQLERLAKFRLGKTVPQ